MKILSIETSCDETAVSILEGTGQISSARLSVLGNALYSQAEKHAAYGGVYPSLAKREHQENLAPLTAEALRQANLVEKTTLSVVPTVSLSKIRDDAFRDEVRKFLETQAKPAIDYIAVTHGPGLEPALWTGINFAEALGEGWRVPVLGINHMEGHIVSALLKETSKHQFSVSTFQFPLLALLISGGHTELILMKEWFSYARIGMTKDDAVGEAFDKVARLLDFPYPGGPKIQEAAENSRERGGTKITFPSPLIREESCDFSFSGLKTAVLYKLRDMEKISERDKEEIAQAFEDAARAVIVSKTARALNMTGAQTVAVGGGVSANEEIRRSLGKKIANDFPGTELLFPEKDMTGDNAVMIGAAAYLRVLSGKKSEGELEALGNLSL